VKLSSAERKAKALKEIQTGELKGFGFDEGLDLNKYQDLVAQIVAGLESKDSLTVVRKIDELIKSAQAGDVANITEDGRAKLEALYELANAQSRIVKADQAEALALQKKEAALDVAGDAAILKAKAKLEIDLFKANATYEKRQKDLAADGDAAILKRQANLEIELFKENNDYQSKEHNKRVKEAEELNKKITELAERLSIPFKAALDLIRQAKEEAKVGLDAFGGFGAFKYGVSSKYTDPKKTSKTKKKSQVEIDADTIASFQKQLDLEDALFGKVEARKQVLRALGEDLVKNNPKIVSDMEAQIVAAQKLIDLEQKRQSIVDTVTSSVESGMMAMVEGTKSVSDAFKTMAHEIIKELYRIYVVKQITGAISNALGGFMASGGSAPTVSDRPMARTFDGGGYTGNGPRSGGLDGNGGFMAMMHPQETVTDHTKGKSSSSGDNIVIHQNFNFQANGDDTVKKLIAQAAPKIMSMTKTSLIEDRRRGGSTKAAFG
tara:strand:- start:4143 stop:5621 length:1479 start_codon:yes stop_codon:yes gene_type:complete